MTDNLNNETILYLVVYDYCADYYRRELTVDIYLTREDAQKRYYQLIEDAQKDLPELDEPDEYWVCDYNDVRWSIYLAGNWSCYHKDIFLLIYNIIIK